jgi:hypothetical protein
MARRTHRSDRTNVLHNAVAKKADPGFHPAKKSPRARPHHPRRGVLTMAVGSPKQFLATDLARADRWARDAMTAELRAEHAARAREARDQLAALRIEEKIQEAITAAPALSAYQRERLAAILTSPTP